MPNLDHRGGGDCVNKLGFTVRSLCESDELVMLLRVNVSDQMEVLLLGSLGANVPVRDDDSRPARDKAKEAAQKAARKALGRQEKERRSKSRRLN
jgi:hypothetical protein